MLSWGFQDMSPKVWGPMFNIILYIVIKYTYVNTTLFNNSLHDMA